MGRRSFSGRTNPRDRQCIGAAQQRLIRKRRLRNETAVSRDSLGAHAWLELQSPEANSTARLAPSAPEIRDLPRGSFSEEPISIAPGAEGFANEHRLELTRLSLDADRDATPEIVRYVDRETDAWIRQDEDRNYDGSMDAFLRFDGGRLVGRNLDNNHDGRLDVFETYSAGLMATRSLDLDHDGVVDAYYTYEGRYLALERHDANNDGNIDLVIQYRAAFRPWRGAVLWKKWRLVNGSELYDVASDPGQKENLYERHRDVVSIMRAHYEQWVKETTPLMNQTNFVSVGTLHEATTWLSSCNWTGSYADNWGNLAKQNIPGHWSLQVERGGDYRVSMYMFHPEANVPLGGRLRNVRSRPVTQARLLLDGEATTAGVDPKDTHVTFEISLQKGQKVELKGEFLGVDGKVLSGAFYTFVQKKDEKGKAPSVIKYVSVAGVPRAARPVGVEGARRHRAP